MPAWTIRGSMYPRHPSSSPVERIRLSASMNPKMAAHGPSGGICTPTRPVVQATP